MNPFILIWALISRQLDFRGRIFGHSGTFIPFSPPSATEGSGESPRPPNLPTSYRVPPYKTSTLPHPLSFISSGLLPRYCLINILRQGTEKRKLGPAGWSGGVLVKGPGPPPFFNYAPASRGRSPGCSSLPPCVLRSLSDPPRERAPQPASLPRQPAAFPPPLSSAPAAPRRELPPSCKSGRGLGAGGRQLGLRLRGRRSPDVIAHCISIKQSILDMECGADV